MATKLSAADQAIIDGYKKQWNTALAAGDEQGMQSAHTAVEDILGDYGYSGGADGSQNIPLDNNADMYAGTVNKKPRSQILESPPYYPQTPEYTPLPYYPDGTELKPEPIPLAPIEIPNIIAAGVAPADPQTTSPSGYTPLGTYNDVGLSAQDKKTVEGLQAQWAIEMQNGNVEAAKVLHQQAEEIRAGYGYSGGADGTQQILLGQTPGAQFPDSQKYIEDLYNGYTEAQKRALEAAYEENLNNHPIRHH